jgi:hypothetical protein
MPTPATLYIISGGRVSERQIPPEGLPIHQRRLDVYAKSTAKADPKANEQEHWRSFTLDRISGLTAAITPWATWYCCPLIVDSDDKAWGKAHPKAARAAIKTTIHPTDAISTTLHEAWHLAEDHLTLAEMSAVKAGIENAPELPDSAFNRYYIASIEVRANSFECWAYSYILRGRTPAYYRGMPADERVWTMVLRGDLGRRVARRGLIPVDRQPDHIKAFLAQRSTTQKLMDVTARMMSAAFVHICGGKKQALRT